MSYAEIYSVVVITAAAPNPTRALRRTRWVYDVLRRIRRRKKILTPFPNVARHIINAKFVGAFLRHLMNAVQSAGFGLTRIPLAPTHIGGTVAAAVCATLALVAATRRKLPF